MIKNIQQDKHRYHKNPQFFLKGFAFLGNHIHQKVPDIWVYKKEGQPYKDGINPSLESVKDVGYEVDYYAFTKADGDKDYNTYENKLAEKFENPVRPILEKIRRFNSINDKEKEVFSRYIASMMTRGNFGQKLLFDSQVSERLERRENLKAQGCSEEQITMNLMRLLLVTKKKEKVKEVISEEYKLRRNMLKIFIN